jgi:diguanylate cyclase (GGDEF)-like protein/PAS domain S-box-containing protein
MRQKPTILAVSALLALALWMSDAAVDAFALGQGAFSDLLPGVPARELYLRSFLIAALIFPGLFIARIVRKRNLALEALRESAGTLHTITEAAKDAIIMMDQKGAISFWNPAAEKIFGYAASEVMGRELHALLVPSRYYGSYAAGFSGFKESGAGGCIGKTLELTALRKDGVEFPIELSLSALKRKGGWHAVGVLRDITERRKSEEELRTHREHLGRLVRERTSELDAANQRLRREIIDRARTEKDLFRSESFLNTIFDSFHDPLSIVDREYQLVRFNDAYARMRGKNAAELLGKKCYEVLQNRDCVCSDCLVDVTFQSRDPCAKEKQLTLFDASRVWVEIYTYPIYDSARNVTHVVEYTRDITDRKKEDEEKKQLIKNLNHLSTTDSLTELLNRRALNDILNHEIERTRRYDADLSLILCDIDRFKEINDGFGHTAGDQALQRIAETLKNALRKSDVPGRYGGDEFMIILPETTVAGATSLAEKIRVAVQELDLELPGNKHVRLSLSLGVAGCCSSAENIDTLVAHADAALYEAKQAGRNRISVRGA